MGLMLSPEQRLNPFPLYSMMQENQPVMFIEPYQLWTVFKYEDVKTVLSDYAHFSSGFGDFEQGRATSGHFKSIISMNPPQHTQMRGLISRAFTPGAIAKLEPRIRQIADELLDKVVPTGRMDVVEDFSYPLPVIVIAEMLGIPADDRAKFKHWSDAVVASADAVLDPAKANDPETVKANQEMMAYFRAVIARRREQPGDDLISGLLAAEVEGEKLSEADVLSFCWLLLVAGNETTTNLIGNAVLTFLEHPEALERLVADPSLLPGAIEEVLRYRSPVQAMFRMVQEEVELRGQTLKPGQRVVALIGSANRDPEKFPEPDRFDITRDPNPHIAFGFGIHFCLGAPLARLEARVALGALLERCRGLRRADDAALEPAHGFIVYGVQHLPVTFQGQ